MLKLPLKTGDWRVSAEEMKSFRSKQRSKGQDNLIIIGLSSRFFNKKIVYKLQLISKLIPTANQLGCI